MKRVIGKDGVSLWSTLATDDDEPIPWRWLALLASAALILRVINLNGGLWYDEILALIENIRSPLSSIVTEFPGNNQHTFFSLLAHLSTRLFGEYPWAMRLPSLVFGVAAVPVLYLFAREFVSRTEALLACTLLTVAYHPVWFSQNARGYSMLAFFTLLSSWLLMRGLRRGRTIDAVAYGLAGAFGVYTHLTMVFLVISHALLCLAAAVLHSRESLWQRRGRFAVMAFVFAGAFTLLLYSPLLLQVKQFFIEHPNRSTPATPAWAVGELIRGLKIGVGAGAGAIVALVLLTLGLRSYLKQSMFITGVFILPGVITLAATVALGRPIFPRFAFFLIGFALLLGVRGALEMGAWIERRVRPGLLAHWSGGSLIVSLMAGASIMALMFNYRYPKQDFEGALHYVEDHRAANETIITAGLTNRVYRQYYNRPFATVSTFEEFKKVRAEGQPVWVLYTLPQYIDARSPELLRALRSDCLTEAVFKGTVGQGDVTVCRTRPVE